MLKLDKDGKAFIEVDNPILRFKATEPILNAKGEKIGVREFEKTHQLESEKIYDLESRGYFKKLVWSVLTKGIGYIPQEIEGLNGQKSVKFKPYYGFSVLYFEFNADKMSQNHICANPKLYLRKMPSGCYQTCAYCGVTTGPLATDIFAKSGTSKIAERQVTRELAIKEFFEGKIDFIDISLRKELRLPEM